MRVLIVDDEPLARARMVSLLGDIPDIDVVGQAGDGENALVLCAQLQPDTVLLDIEMPAMDGTAVARKLSGTDRAPQIIFCTAYDNHALGAFDVGAVDYLLKPVRVERLREALARAARRLQAAPSELALHVRSNGESRRLDFAQVLYFLADEKYVAVHHSTGTWLIDESLRQLEQAYGDRLVRLHRNCLVPRQRLLGLRTLADGRVLARLVGTEVTPEVSRRNLAAVRERLRSG
jgi:two-component system response regulator AlgR